MAQRIEADPPEHEGGVVAEVAGDVAVSGFMQRDREDDRQGVDRDGLDEIEFHGRRLVFYQSGIAAPRALPVMPDGFQIVGQLRQRAQIGPALPLAVIVGTARSGEAEFARDAGEFGVLLG